MSIPTSRRPDFKGERAPLPFVLDDSQVRAVAELAWRVGNTAAPQDIEWAIEGPQMHPAGSPDHDDFPIVEPGGPHRDNSNIGRAIAASTLLTFSFARRAYEEVYRQFCRLLRSGKVLHRTTTSLNMSG